MGRGDVKKTKKGKISNGSFGKTSGLPKKLKKQLLKKHIADFSRFKCKMYYFD